MPTEIKPLTTDNHAQEEVIPQEKISMMETETFPKANIEPVPTVTTTELIPVAPNIEAPQIESTTETTSAVSQNPSEDIDHSGLDTKDNVANSGDRSGQNAVGSEGTNFESPSVVAQPSPEESMAMTDQNPSVAAQTEVKVEQTPIETPAFQEITNGFGEDIKTADDFYNKVLLKSLRAGGRLVIIGYDGKIYRGITSEADSHEKLLEMIVKKTNVPFDVNKVDFSTAIEFSTGRVAYGSQKIFVGNDADREEFTMQDTSGTNKIPGRKGFNDVGKQKMAELFSKIPGIECSWMSPAGAD